MEQETSSSVNWKPLESNPTVINDYVSTIGFDTSVFSFQEMFSIEDWAQAMIQRPCLGLLFIFPDNKAQKEHKKEVIAKIIEEGQEVHEDLFYMHQYARNACGTVGVFHILGNLPEAQREFLLKDSVLDQFYQSCKGKTWEERGKLFMNSKKVKESHVAAVNNGETQVIFYY